MNGEYWAGSIFSRRERFSGICADVIEARVHELFWEAKYKYPDNPIAGSTEAPGITVLIAAASYLSFPASDRWTDKRERRRLGMEKSSVPE